MADRAQPSSSADAATPGGERGSIEPRVLLALLGVALLVRVVATLASGGFARSYSALYEGDMSVWLEAARAGASGQAFELGLPVRPPGTRFLVGLFATVERDGAIAMTTARVFWVLLGALAAPAWYAALRPCGRRVALAVGLALALGGGVVQLALTPNSEAPYLLVVACSIGLLVRRQPQRGPLAAFGFGALQGLGCLLRVEHALAVLLWAAWIARDARAFGGKGAWSALGRAAAVAFGVLLVTLPHNLRAHHGIVGFERRGAPPAAARLRWEPGARAEIETLPAFLRASMAAFVEVTLAHRQRRDVRAGDVATLCQEAFGWQPRGLPDPVFIALYGPLNFRLANGPENRSGGFTRAALDQPPPLAGGPSRYAPIWLRSLPNQGNIAFEYPGHLRLVCEGYRLGIDWIAANPGDWLRLVGRKLAIAWAGAAHGLGGSAVPFGPGGLRRQVDLTVPQGAGATLWRWLVLALAGAGLIAGRRRRPAALIPLWLWTAGLLAVTVGFFGYARIGAMLTPALAVAVVGVMPDVVARWLARRWGRLPCWGWLVAVILLADLLGWWLTGDALLVDGVEPGPPGRFPGDAQVTFR